MYIIVIGYSSNSVWYLEEDFGDKGSEAIEKWLVDEQGFDLDQIAWACSDQPFELHGFE